MTLLSANQIAYIFRANDNGKCSKINIRKYKISIYLDKSNANTNPDQFFHVRVKENFTFFNTSLCYKKHFTILFIIITYKCYKSIQYIQYEFTTRES